MIYLKKFETEAQYTAAESGLILPNVSLVSETNGLHYKPYVPTPSHEYVEIGGVKWATMNVGANSITDTGLYFQWGDTQGYTASQVGNSTGHKAFSESYYKYVNSLVMTKYNGTDGRTVLGLEDDAVRTNWGGSWRMPTVAEFQALGNAVNTAWTTNYQGSGVAGLVCTDKTDSSKVLFFPAAGHVEGTSIGSVSDAGYYWSSSLNNERYGNILLFTSSNNLWNHINYRYYGCSVRGVVD